MWKYYLILLLLLKTTNLYAEEIKKENLLLLDCKNVDFIDEGFYYPIEINKFSSFKFGKNNEDIYQFDFIIRKEFKFPKENLNNFIPIYEGKVKGVCYNDIIPELMSYIYKEARDNKNKVSTYLHKINNLFYLEIKTK